MTWLGDLGATQSACAATVPQVGAKVK